MDEARRKEIRDQYDKGRAFGASPAEVIELLDSEASLRAKLEKANDLITLYVMKGPHDNECHPSEFRHTEECKMRKRTLADYKSIK